MPDSYESDYLIHPTTLDTVIQAIFVVVPTMDKNIPKQAWVPTAINSIRILSDIPCAPGTTFHGISESQLGISRELIGCIMAGDGVFDSPPSIIVDELTMTGLGITQDSSQTFDSTDGTDATRLYALPVWKQDLDLIKSSELRKVADEKYGQHLHMAQFCSDSLHLVNELCRYALQTIGSKVKYASLPHHLRKYFDWMQSRCQIIYPIKRQDGTAASESPRPPQGIMNGTRHDGDDSVTHKLNAFYTKYPVDGKLLQTVFHSLDAILSLEVVPIALLMEEDNLSKFYRDAHGLHVNMQILRDWFDLRSHKSPNLRVIEIGAGTASATLPVLQQLSNNDTTQTPRFSKWTFTDISPGWFENAKQVLSEWNERIDYKVLDIDKDPLEQGFEAESESYDVVLAVNVSTGL
jgi:hypothetical protein